MKNRRNFLKVSAVFGAGRLLVPHVTHALTKSPEKEILKVGLIGVGFGELTT